MDYAIHSQQFIGLFKEVFKKDIDANYLNWKFINTPEGKAIGYGAWENGELVGSVALWPVRFVVAGKEIVACAGGDTMVSETQRGKGLFTMLSRELFKEISGNNWAFRYSIPGPMSFPGYIKKLNHSHIMDLPYYVKFNVKALFHYAVKSKKLFSQYDYRGYSVSIENTIPPDHDSLLEKTADRFTLMQKRNGDYMRWRFERNPVNKYSYLSCRHNGNMMGYIVLARNVVADILAVNNVDVYVALLKAADAYFAGMGEPYQHIWCAGDDQLESSLLKNAWSTPDEDKKWHLKKQPLIVMVNDTVKESAAALDKKAWRFTMADVDFI